MPKIDSISFYQRPPTVLAGNSLSVFTISLIHKKQVNYPKRLVGQLIVVVSPYGTFGLSARLPIAVELANNAML